jgi:hypothetical protein
MVAEYAGRVAKLDSEYVKLLADHADHSGG